MTDIDAIALELTTELDRVYPPMRWTARWSDGNNIPFGLAAESWLRRAIKIPDYYRAGLWLFSEEWHGHLVPDIGSAADGLRVTAWNRAEAVCASP
jgi:hypothetical protein